MFHCGFDDHRFQFGFYLISHKSNMQDPHSTTDLTNQQETLRQTYEGYRKSLWASMAVEISCHPILCIPKQAGHFFSIAVIIW